MKIRKCKPKWLLAWCKALTKRKREEHLMSSKTHKSNMSTHTHTHTFPVFMWSESSNMQRGRVEPWIMTIIIRLSTNRPQRQWTPLWRKSKWAWLLLLSSKWEWLVLMSKWALRLLLPWLLLLLLLWSGRPRSSSLHSLLIPQAASFTDSSTTWPLSHTHTHTHTLACKSNKSPQSSYTYMFTHWFTCNQNKKSA